MGQLNMKNAQGAGTEDRGIEGNSYGPRKGKLDLETSRIRLRGGSGAVRREGGESHEV